MTFSCASAVSRETANFSISLKLAALERTMQRVGGVAGGDFDEFLGLLAGQLLVEGLDLLGQVLRVDIS